MAAPSNSDQFVRWLRQVAPYVHAFRGRTFVVAFGGELFSERARFLSFVHDLTLLAALGIRLVLVHGARPQIEAELKARGARSRYAQGLRITDEAALTAVKQAAGVLRIEIEAVLSQGLPRSPMAGAQIPGNSGNSITARPIDGLVAAGLCPAPGRGPRGPRRYAREAAPGAHRGCGRHDRADRAARGRRHAGEAQPRAAGSRDRQFPGGRARRRDPRPRRA